MQLYEFTYLISLETSEENIKSLQERTKSLIQEEGGSVVNSTAPIKKNLAYPIKKRSTAFLANLTFSLNPEKLKTFKKKVKSEKEIIRYLLLRKKRLVKKEKRKVRVKPETKARKKVELKEIEKKLEEILDNQ